MILIFHPRKSNKKKDLATVNVTVRRSKMITLTTKTLEERKALLAQAVQAQVVQGARIESQADTSAVMLKGRPVNHVLHLLVTIFTLGFWTPVWLILAICGGEKRSLVSVDEYGLTLIQKV